MHPGMLRLAERLVVAMETISQDVKNISAHVYDISCNVSYLLNEKKIEEHISVVVHDEENNPVGREASEEREYSGQYEPADERPSSHADDTDQEETFIRASGSFTGINIEEPSEDEITDETYDMQNIYRNSQNIHKDMATCMTIFTEEQARSNQMESAENNLAMHMSGYPEERPHKCSVCGKSFKERYDLQRHTRLHTGEKPYKCNVCGKAFTTNGNLTIHMRSHTGEKPYCCNICGRSFPQSSKLTRHMRSHTGEKPYKCTFCGNAFSRNVSLREHELIHIGEKPFKCAFCEKRFRRHYRYTQHMRTHSAGNFSEFHTT